MARTAAQRCVQVVLRERRQRVRPSGEPRPFVAGDVVRIGDEVAFGVLRRGPSASRSRPIREISTASCRTASSALDRAEKLLLMRSASTKTEKPKQAGVGRVGEPVFVRAMGRPTPEPEPVGQIRDGAPDEAEGEGEQGEDRRVWKRIREAVHEVRHQLDHASHAAKPDFSILADLFAAPAALSSAVAAVGESGN